MNIKKAKAEDHQALTEIMRKSKAIWGYDKAQLEKWKDALTISKEYLRNNETFKLCDSNRIAGFYSYHKQYENLKLDNLFVHPDYIGKGFGKLMLDDFLDRSKSISKERIILDSDPNAEPFYQKHNFITIGLQSTSIRNRFMPVMVWNDPEEEKNELFDSERLYVRHLRQDDIKGFYEMQSNPAVMKYIKPAMNYEESQQELNRFMSYYDKRDMMFRIWALVEKETEKFVGICGVYLNDKNEMEIAYRLQESNWGKGFGKEIAKALVNFCFTTLDYDRLVAYVMEGNIGSRKILDGMMDYEGVVKSKTDNSKSHFYSIQKENWL